MKNSLQSIKKKIISRYAVEDNSLNHGKKTDINVLLNRVKIDKKKESIKRILFIAATSSGVFFFGVLIF